MRARTNVGVVPEWRGLSSQVTPSWPPVASSSYSSSSVGELIPTQLWSISAIYLNNAGGAKQNRAISNRGSAKNVPVDNLLSLPERKHVPIIMLLSYFMEIKVILQILITSMKL